MYRDNDRQPQTTGCNERNNMFSSIRTMITITLITLLIVPPQYALALPQGGQVVDGQATLTYGAGTLDVLQQTDKAIINYDSFSIAQPEAVHFQQPNSSSIALNRVTGGNPSEILGTLSANGRVFIINPNGIMFGSGSQVDTAGLVASTLDMANADFMSGNYQFAGQGGAVLANGRINTPGGYVALLGSHVENNGVIQANLGSIALASGEAMTLNLDAQGFVNVVVDAAASVSPPYQAGVANRGTLQADGGQILLTAKTLDHIFDHAINNQGVLEARSISVSPGRIILSADKDIKVGGDVSGGTIDITSTEEDVTHLTGNRTTTSGESFTGSAKKDYVLMNDTQINAGAGDIDIHAGQNIEMGSLIPTTYDGAKVTSTHNVFLTADQGHIRQAKGDIFAENLMLNANLGIYGSSCILNCSSQNLDMSGILTADNHYALFVADREGNGLKFIGRNELGPEGNPGEFNWNLPESWNFDVNTGDHLYVLAWNTSLPGMYIGDFTLPDTSKLFSNATQWENYVSGNITPEINGLPSFSNLSAEIAAAKWSAPQAFVANGSPTWGTIPGIDPAAHHIWHDTFDLGTQQGGPEVSSSFGHYAVFRTDATVLSGPAPVIANSGLVVTADHISAINKSIGDINLHNTISGEVNNLSSQTGTNPTVTGQNGVTNNAPGGSINVTVDGDLTVNADIVGHGNITLTTGDNLVQNSNINIIQSNTVIPPPINVHSTSHQTGVWSNDDTIDLEWQLAPEQPGRFSYTANTTGQYTMNTGAVVNTTNGDATITSQGDVTLTLVHAGNGVATVTSTQGSIIDGDLSVSPADQDVAAHSIHLNAPLGSVGSVGPQQEIDLGIPYGFSHLLDENTSTNPDGSIDSFTSALNAQGEWIYATSIHTLLNSDHLWFHVATVDPVSSQQSTSAHAGPYLIDTIAPVITADYDPANPYGWYNYDVDVQFDATDNLSGFAPQGSLAANLGSQTTAGEGFGLMVTSAGIFDRAGNQALPLSISLNVDKTKPIITGSNVPTPNQFGWFNHDVTVDFSATDNLSGFAPNGALSSNLLSSTTTGEGVGLIVNSSGVVVDRAGNIADPIQYTFNVDKTAPIITAGNPIGPLNPDGTYQSSVTVPFSATDNLSGFAPNGSQSENLASKTTPNFGQNLLLTSDSTVDLAGNQALPITVGPFNLAAAIPPIVPPPTNLVDTLVSFTDRQPVYYEILSPSRFVSFEPVVKIGLLAYHPITTLDTTAFAEVDMDIRAFDFIDNAIEQKGKKSPYLGF